MSRKSYLILMSPTSFDPCKHVTKADFKYLPLGGFSLLFVGIRLVSWVHCRNPTSPHSALSLMSKWRPSSTRFALRPSTSSQAPNWSDDRHLVQVFSYGCLFLFCALILHCSVLTLNFSRGTAGVGHPLITDPVFPLNRLRLSVIGAPTPFSSIQPCL